MRAPPSSAVPPLGGRLPFPVSLRLGVICCLLVGCLVAFASPAAGRAASAERDPVIFVHGFMGGGSNWNSMIDDFVQDGWRRDRLFAWSYDWSRSNVATARGFGAEVDRVLAATGASKVDVVTHSMGGVSSRWYLKFLGGADKVDDWISLAGPNHGIFISTLCSWVLPSCKEMAVGSDLLATLNSGGETLGDVRYGTFWSYCDEIIIPHSSVPLEGAENVKVGCVEHAAFLISDQVSQRVRAFVR